MTRSVYLDTVEEEGGVLLVVSQPANCELKLTALLSLSDSQEYTLWDEQGFLENETRNRHCCLDIR